MRDFELFEGRNEIGPLSNTPITIKEGLYGTQYLFINGVFYLTFLII